MGDFSRKVASWSEKTGGKMDLVVQKIALDLFSRVILRSPVDTGRFRGNWQVAIGSVPSGTLEVNDATGEATVGKVQAAALGVNAGDTIYLVNNLPYAQKLEDGSSKQAPAGMVALSVQDFQSIADRAGFELVRV